MTCSQRPSTCLLPTNESEVWLDLRSLTAQDGVAHPADREPDPLVVETSGERTELRFSPVQRPFDSSASPAGTSRGRSGTLPVLPSARTRKHKARDTLSQKRRGLARAPLVDLWAYMRRGRRFFQVEDVEELGNLMVDLRWMAHGEVRIDPIAVAPARP